MPHKKIQLIIRDAGLASRRGADDLIREGRVTLNGHVVTDLAAEADLDHDHLKVDGKPARVTSPVKLYYVLHKPRHVVSTFRDPEGRPCLGDLLGNLARKVFSVGRLDFDAEGLMILTNDGALAERFAHPSHRVPRTYLVKVSGEPDDQRMSQIGKGMWLGNGDRLGDVQWEVVERRPSSSWIKVTLYEGKKSELKRIFLGIGHPVRKIRRIAFGPIYLGKLPVGGIRPFTPTELRRISDERPMTIPPRRSFPPKAEKGREVPRQERDRRTPLREDRRAVKRPDSDRDARPPQDRRRRDAGKSQDGRKGSKTVGKRPGSREKRGGKTGPRSKA